MAGGKGTRLGDLTKNPPKLMLKVARHPVLERRVLHLVGNGIRLIFISMPSSSDGNIQRVCAVIAGWSQPPAHPFHVLHRQQRGLAAHLALMLVQKPLPPAGPL